MMLALVKSWKFENFKTHKKFNFKTYKTLFSDIEYT